MLVFIIIFEMYLSKERKINFIIKQIGLLKHGFHAWVNCFQVKVSIEDFYVGISNSNPLEILPVLSGLFLPTCIIT